jgi:hypothetical protein
LRQAVLDEVAGLAQRSRIHGSAIGLLRALISSARRGTFVPAAGIEVGYARASAGQTPAHSDEPESRLSDSERAEVKRKLAELRKTLVASASRRSQ